ncbi:hypothetical protein PQ455_14545 [Sphingomonas naphthae]|uniref:Uncharacterized protein n=1 Tax=Sphingomonas naphthae TaxID=1813468 RepID=A0ABY7TI88_9SPHN|nr:hypothetical protein [Sphingomonas naphthae]WCT72844.1 hypothetical protein PQ455_14545 [Sphingomonas naphthae]
MIRLPVLGLVALPLLLVGCSGPIGNAPSLAPRPIEKTADVDAPIAGPVAEATPAAADPAIVAKIEAALKAADAGQRAFAAEEAKATAAVDRAKGQPVGSDAWVAAQTALSGLQSARGGVQDAAQQIDALREAHPNATDADLAAIEEAAEKVTAIATAAGDTVSTLTARLPE